MKYIATLALLICPMLVYAADRIREEETIDRTIPLESGGRLSIKNVNGDITLSTWGRGEMRMQAHKVAKARTAERAREILEETDIEITEMPDHIRIVTRQPSDGSLFKRADVRVGYTLTVPEVIALDLESVNGNIKAPSTQGKAEVETVNGDIDLRGTRGSVKAETVNGSIDLTDIQSGVEADTVNGQIEISIAAQIDEDIQAETVNGSIRLELPEGFAGYLNASTANGSIRTEFPITVKGRFLGKSLKGDINGGGKAEIKLETLNGGIRIIEN